MARVHYGVAQYAYARRMAVAGKIIFGGAFVFVGAAFAAAVYAWGKD
jgi:hypothetical protein